MGNVTTLTGYTVDNGIKMKITYRYSDKRANCPEDGFGFLLFFQKPEIAN
jgi:hypothetical protein